MVTVGHSDVNAMLTVHQDTQARVSQKLARNASLHQESNDEMIEQPNSGYGPRT